MPGEEVWGLWGVVGRGGRRKRWTEKAGSRPDHRRTQEAYLKPLDIERLISCDKKPATNKSKTKLIKKYTQHLTTNDAGHLLVVHNIPHEEDSACEKFPLSLGNKLPHSYGRETFLFMR